MKKNFYLIIALVFSLGLISCSSDDDSPTVTGPQFTIVGTWKVTNIFINGIEHNVNDYCPYKGLFQFINGGTYVENPYTQNGINCISTDAIGGTWSNLGNTYTISLTNNVSSSVLPTTFHPITDEINLNKFELNLTAGGIPTKLIFTKQ